MSRRSPGTRCECGAIVNERGKCPTCDAPALRKPHQRRASLAAALVRRERAGAIIGVNSQGRATRGRS